VSTECEKCQKTEIIDVIRDDIREIKTDVKDILKFKYQTVGIIVACSAFFTILGNALILIFKH
jgi:hypothetical protein